MIKNITEIRVRYCETDQMGIVNNANYPIYYEIGRTELLREIGLKYTEVEAAGIMMPLADLYIQFKAPALYDEILTLTTEVKEYPKSKIRFDYTIKNSKGDLLNTGYSSLAFVNIATKRPMRLPQMIQKVIQPFFLIKA